MKKTRLLDNGLLLAVSVAAFGIFQILYPRLVPEASIRNPIERSEARIRGEDFIQSMGYDVSRHRLRLSMEVDGNAVAFLEKKLGPSETNRLLR
ncbi:MAG TPA: hypothetical protein VGB38_00790, partial [bacterium]